MTTVEINTCLQQGFPRMEDFLGYGLRLSEFEDAPHQFYSPQELTCQVRAAFLDCVEDAVRNWQFGFLNKRTGWRGFGIHYERHHQFNDANCCVFTANWNCEKIGNHLLVFCYERSDMADLKVIGLRQNVLGGTENAAVVAFRHERAMELIRQARKINEMNRQALGRRK